MEIDEFKALSINEQIEYLNSTCAVGYGDPEYYLCLCEELGLIFSGYKTQDSMWSAILEASGC